MDWDYKFETMIKNFNYKGIYKFIVVPYGELGKEIVCKLKKSRGRVDNIKVYDNYKNNIEKINSIYKVNTNEIILLSLLNGKKQVIEELYGIVEKNKVVDMFPDYVYIASQLDKLTRENAIYSFLYEDKKMNFRLPYVGTDLIENHIAWFHTFFEEELLYYIFYTWKDKKIKRYVKDKIVLDVGANIGNHTIYFSKVCTAGLTYAFEPSDVVCEILKENIRINNMEYDVKVMNVAVGSKDGRGIVDFFNTNNMGCTKIREIKDGPIKVIAIDDLCFDKKVGFIKIDVEGMEMEVLQGALNTIKKDKPYITLETWGESNNIEKIRKMLIPIGYHEERISKTDFLFFID